MAVSNRQHNNLAERRTVDLAVAAVPGPVNVIDMPIDGFDPSPGYLGIDDGGEESECAHGRCARTAEEGCIICGSRLCDVCA